MFPDRFSVLAGVDQYRGMQGLRDLQQAVQEPEFVGAHLYPHWFKLAPNEALHYLYYAKCYELNIPIMMQVGQNLIYQKEVRLPSVAGPILLDQIAIDFPELRLLGIQVGIPWTDEMITMAWRHANASIGIDAFAPKYLPPTLVHYMNSYGTHQVLFGTDWPVIDPERAVSEMQTRACGSYRCTTCSSVRNLETSVFEDLHPSMDVCAKPALLRLVQRHDSYQFQDPSWFYIAVRNQRHAIFPILVTCRSRL